MLRNLRRDLAVGAWLLAFVLAVPATAQDEGADAATGDAPAAKVEEAPAAAKTAEAPAGNKDEQLKKLWGDLIHYIAVARADLAVKFGEKILESDFTDLAIYRMMVDTDGSRQELERAANLPEMRALVIKLLERIERGYQADRGNPEMIAREIQRLGGTLAGYRLAKGRLIKSGEYAVPQLIQKLRDRETDEALKQRIVTVLPDLGKDGVRAMSVALQSRSPKLVEILARALGEIGYPHAAPRLREALDRKNLQGAELAKVRQAVSGALMACAGEAALRKTAAELFYEQAMKYYYRAESVRADSRFARGNVWYWREDIGTTYRPVARAVFCDVYAMRMARLALQYDSKFYPAIGLWLSAIVRKEENLPPNENDPTWPAHLRKANFYMLAASARYQQDVLARALKDHDAVVAMAAINALAETAGAESLVKPTAGGAQPLVKALTFPDIRVRMLAAISLGRALPQADFAGSDLVLPVLNQAFRISGARRAMLVGPEDQLPNRIKGVLRAKKWLVLHKPTAAEATDAARTVSGVDLVVIAVRKGAETTLKALRREAPFVMLPALVAPDPSDEARHLPKLLGRCVVLEPKSNDEQIADRIAEAAKMADAGKIPPDEAATWAIRAALTIRSLGLTDNRVLDIQRARAGLIEVLADERPKVRLAAATALAVTRAAPAQQALAALALGAKADQDVRIMTMRLCTQSVRRFGSMITGAQAQSVLELVRSKDTPADLRDAAAQLLGSLNLPSERIESLIVQTDK